jgi:hypothetical protein
MTVPKISGFIFWNNRSIDGSIVNLDLLDWCICEKLDHSSLLFSRHVVCNREDKLTGLFLIIFGKFWFLLNSRFLLNSGILFIWDLVFWDFGILGFLVSRSWGVSKVIMVFWVY